jgi:hypothetical protein
MPSQPREARDAAGADPLETAATAARGLREKAARLADPAAELKDGAEDCLEEAHEAHERAIEAHRWAHAAHERAADPNSGHDPDPNTGS